MVRMSGRRLASTALACAVAGAGLLVTGTAAHADSDCYSGHGVKICIDGYGGYDGGGSSFVVNYSLCNTLGSSNSYDLWLVDRSNGHTLRNTWHYTGRMAPGACQSYSDQDDIYAAAGGQPGDPLSIYASGGSWTVGTDPVYPTPPWP